jgi:hypothetical protein
MVALTLQDSSYGKLSIPQELLVLVLLLSEPEEGDIIIGAIDFVVGTLEDRYRVKANRRVSFREKLPRLIKTMTPAPVKQIAKNLLPRSITKRLDWQGIRFLDCVDSIEQRGVYVDRKEMSTITEMIRVFHQQPVT